MQTIKTGVVIVLLIAVCYGAFVALNAPEADIPKELQQWANSEEFEGLMDIEMPSGDDVDVGFELGSAQTIVAGGVTTGAEVAEAGDVSSLPSFPSFPTVEPSQPLSSNASASNEAETPQFPAAPLLLAGEETDAALSATPVRDSMNSAAAAAQSTPTLDGPAVPFTTDEPVADFPPPTALVSSRIDNSAGASSSWPNGQDLSLLPDGNPADSSAEMSHQESLPTVPFSIAREQALLKASAGQLREALETLSPYYDSPEVGHKEHIDLVDILDALSREVIYSDRHLIEPAYHVEVNDTVASVAQKYQISPELLTSINGMGNSKALVAGSKIKIVQGPFRARVSLNRGELTLFLGDLYAGRFPISIGKDNPPTVGVYFIEDRSRNRTYYGTGGQVIQAGNPENPYGGYWLSMGNDLSIHGSPEMDSSDLKNAGCISLAPLDAADVYNILTKQSQVEIRL